MEKEELNLKKSYYILSRSIMDIEFLQLLERSCLPDIVEQNRLLEKTFYKRLEKIVCIGKIQESRNVIVEYRKDAFRLVYQDTIIKALGYSRDCLGYCLDFLILSRQYPGQSSNLQLSQILRY
jgi:hypothetical protein